MKLFSDIVKKAERKKQALSRPKQSEPAIYFLSYDKKDQSADFKATLVERLLELDLECELQSPVESTIYIKTFLENSYDLLLDLFEIVEEEGKTDRKPFYYVIARTYEVHRDNGDILYAYHMSAKEPLNGDFKELVKSIRDDF